MASSNMLAENFLKLRYWLFEAVLPLWQEHGVDWKNGGFHEKLGPDARFVVNVPRRTRVVARQIYSFAAAGRMGWSGDWQSAFEHGAKSLFEDCVRPDGLVVSTYTVENGVDNQEFDLYDHAFALFAFAELARCDRHAKLVTAAADRMLQAMNGRFLAPKAGWLDSENGENLLRSNPHMHMLEAMLALYAETGNSSWANEADKIVELALKHFISPDTGALHEYFDLDWKFMSDERGRIVEPGHQFEWAWLLRRWLTQSQIENVEVQAAAEKLCRIGEEYGVTQSGLTLDELWDDLTPKLTTSRTWPQTERVKACLSQAQLASSTCEARAWEDKAAEAIMGILRFAHPSGHKGLWYDRLKDDGTAHIEPSPASSLYHIMCAAETANDYLADKQPIG
jgi:mannose/cellobiose epimerase-like protein (N-acyl-D-glucosamine 2-epimerase family)